MKQKDRLREIIARNPTALDSTGGIPEEDKKILFRIGHPSGWVWLAYEAEQVEMDDILCYGRRVSLGDDTSQDRLGYFSVDAVLEQGGVAILPRQKIG